MASPGIRPEDITTDRAITGKIQKLWVEAISHFGYTQIDAAVYLIIEMLDHQSSVKTKFNLKNEDASKGVFFQNGMIQDDLNEILSAGLNHIQVNKQ